MQQAAVKNVRSYVYFKSIVGINGTDYASIPGNINFNKAPPRKATILDWERLAFGFGSVKDRPRSGWKKTREETCAGVAASIEQSPIKSTRKRAVELCIPRKTISRDHMKKDLKVRS
ncbi:hypothetical protein C0J52_22236 [Blattella germanica]|nr:hypothetical protein C0J52_22236 [Blattella germanica]